MSDLDASYTLPASWSWMKLYSGRPRKTGSAGAERSKLPVLVALSLDKKGFPKTPQNASHP
jgi:hypothetical protein